MWQAGAHEKSPTRHVESVTDGRAADHGRDAVTAVGLNLEQRAIICTTSSGDIRYTR